MKYSGIHFDEILTWATHIKTIKISLKYNYTS